MASPTVSTTVARSCHRVRVLHGLDDVVVRVADRDVAPSAACLLGFSWLDEVTIVRTPRARAILECCQCDPAADAPDGDPVGLSQGGFRDEGSDARSRR